MKEILNPVDSLHNNIKFFGVAPWRLVPLEPRHNTWHNSLFDNSLKIKLDLEYIGLRKNHPTAYITQILPESILKRFPYISIWSFFDIVRVLNKSKKEKSFVYIFEGSLFWYVYFSCLRYFVPNSVFVCNLFPSSRYNLRFFTDKGMKRIYQIMFLLIKKQNKKSVFMTFDTDLMTDKVNSYTSCNLIKFPVPSSFSYRVAPDFEAKLHYRVLVNMRAFPEDELHDLLKNSCQECIFVFPRGTLISQSLAVNFGHYQNTHFDDKVVPIAQYESYVDQHDYMIFLYKPSIDASGRILDAITRGIPVCVPKQATEWAKISKQFGRVNLYSWDDNESLIKTFSHPTFSKLSYIGEPTFTPTKVLAEFSRILMEAKIVAIRFKYFKKFTTLIFIFLHSMIASIMSLIYSVVFHIKKSF